MVDLVDDTKLYFDWKDTVAKNEFLGKSTVEIMLKKLLNLSFEDESIAARSTSKRKESVYELSRRLSVFQQEDSRRLSTWSSKFDEDGFEKIEYKEKINTTILSNIQKYQIDCIDLTFHIF